MLSGRLHTHNAIPMNYRRQQHRIATRARSSTTRSWCWPTSQRAISIRSSLETYLFRESRPRHAVVVARTPLAHSPCRTPRGSSTRRVVESRDRALRYRSTKRSASVALPPVACVDHTIALARSAGVPIATANLHPLARMRSGGMSALGTKSRPTAEASEDCAAPSEIVPRAITLQGWRCRAQRDLRDLAGIDETLGRTPPGSYEVR